MILKKIKNILNFIIVLCMMYQTTYAQQITIKTIESRLITNEGVEFVGELKDVRNDVYSFSNWNNKGILFVNQKQYYLSNINFNVSSNAFDSRIKRDKLFAFKNSEIDSVKINNALFKKVRNTFYEVLYEKGVNQLLKKHAIEIQKGIVNRLDGKAGRSKELLDFQYLIKSDDVFKKIELNKKAILDLFEKKDLLEEFVKKERLSFKKEDDIVKMLDYMFKNSSKII
jgi:hypothetical protein